ncbi:MAG TPA: hypothetical protein PKH58_09300 [Paludibacteraceae bacterium]|nr:hypothetical protein [Paludibacteraceae bacterium]
MKKVLILAAFVIFAGIASTSFAQKHEVKSTWFKNGSVLTYHVQNVTKEYDYIVSDLVLGLDVAFKWKMTDPVNYKGNITIYDAAIDTAMKMVNYFENNSSLNLTNSTTAMFSRKAYKQLISQQSINVTVDKDKETIIFDRYENYPIEVDGVKQDVEVMVAKSESGKKFWILDNPKYPLILKMELAFTIDLRSVVTAK